MFHCIFDIILCLFIHLIILSIYNSWWGHNRLGHSHFGLPSYHSLRFDHRLWLSWFLRKILMLKITYDTFGCLLVAYLCLYHFELFIFFRLLHFHIYMIFTFHIIIFYISFIIDLHVPCLNFGHFICFINFHACPRLPLGHMAYIDKHVGCHIISSPFFQLSLLWSFFVMSSHPVKFHSVSWSFVRVSNFRDVDLETWSLWKLAI